MPALLYQTFFFSCLTIFCYFFCRLIYFKSDKHALLHPMLSSSVILISFVYLSKTPLQNYQDGTQLLSWMIAPLSIALMIPLAENITIVKKYSLAIVLTILICGSLTVIITLACAYILGVSELSLLSLATKSVTTPVALAISQEIKSSAALASLIVIITGVMGVIIAPTVFKVLKIKDQKAQGLTLGLSAHIIGSAYAADQSVKKPIDVTSSESYTSQQSEYVAFSVVSMSIMALVSAFALPFLIKTLF